MFHVQCPRGIRRRKTAWKSVREKNTSQVKSSYDIRIFPGQGVPPTAGGQVPALVKKASFRPSRKLLLTETTIPLIPDKLYKVWMKGTKNNTNGFKNFIKQINPSNAPKTKGR
jgi:hypothetical protein